MADTRVHFIAQALMQIAQTIPSGHLQPEQIVLQAGGVTLPNQDIESLASLIRAIYPATSGGANVTDVAELIRAISPAEAVLADPSGVARLIQALSPAAEEGGRERLQALISALSPAASADRVSAITDTFVRGNIEEMSTAVREALAYTGDARTAVPRLSTRQQQAVAVIREMWPIETQPQMNAEEAAEFVRSLAPADHPVREVAALIAALSPADDTTITNAADAVKFISALYPSRKLSANETALLIRALSPADDRAARRPENVAEVIRALCPTGGPEVSALIRALSPADDPTSRPQDIAKLIRILSPAEITTAEVFRTLSPAEQ